MQDHSELIRKGWPSYGASMAAGSMVTDTRPTGLPGSESEQTEQAAQGVFHDPKATPDLDEITPVQDGEATNSRFSTTYSPSAPAWKMVK